MNNALQTATQNAARRFRHVAVGDLKWQVEKQHLMAVSERNPKVMQCTPESLGNAVLQSASMGLSLNPVLQHCYIIPRRMKRNDDNSPMIAYASPSYRGLVHLASAYGGCQWMRAEVVYRADHFVYKGPAEAPEHHPTLQANARKDQHIIGAYACVKTAQGDVLTEYVDRETIERARQASEYPNSFLWKSWYTEACKKVAIRRLYKTTPSIQVGPISAAVGVMDQYEGGATYEGEFAAKEEVETLTDDQYEALKEVCEEFDKPVDKALGHLAGTFGVDSIRDLPAHRFEDAREFMRDAFERQRQG